MPALATTLLDKVWGSPDTLPWFDNPEGRQIGEIWFAASPAFPLLVKLLFTSDRMSVQVHPDDAYARVHENSNGKTEMWRVLRAEPGAQVALGLNRNLDREALRRAAESGEIRHILHWVNAFEGDTFFIPAGTIHAIGKGLVLCEVQQLSDVTYRLYDYGRDRPLHINHAVNVASLEPWKPHPTSCAYFETEFHTIAGEQVFVSPSRDTMFVILEGEGLIGNDAFRAGQAFEIPANSGSITVQSQRASIMTTYRP